jgi:ABC-type sugar transport system ATPase subunit
MTMADKIVVMRDGIVEQIGTPLELYDRRPTLRRRLHRLAGDEHARASASSKAKGFACMKARSSIPARRRAR